MTGLTVSALALLLVAGYVSALTLALHRNRRSRLQHRFEQAGRERAGVWVAEHRDGLLLALTMLGTITRGGFLVFTVLAVHGQVDPSGLTLTSLVVAASGALLAIWLLCSVIAMSIARHIGEGLVLTSYAVLRTVGTLGRPLGAVLFWVDESIRRLSGVEQANTPGEQELLRSIEESHLEGGLDRQAVQMLENVVEFRSAEVSEVMTPRTDIEGIEYTDDLATIRSFISQAGHSRIPVYQEDLDHIEGILYVKDLVAYLGADASGFELRPLLRKPIVAPETKSVPELLRDFQSNEVHLAIVIDEYGGTAGLVTIEDVLEEIVGEIHDEHEPDDDEEPTLKPVGEWCTEVDGRFHIDDLNEQLDLELPEDEDYDTVAGFMLASLGRVPSVGDAFESHNARFTTIEATETHIERVSIELLEAPVANGGSSGDQPHSAGE